MNNYGQTPIHMKLADTTRAIKEAQQLWMNTGTCIEHYEWIAVLCIDTDFQYTGVMVVVNIPKDVTCYGA